MNINGFSSNIPSARPLGSRLDVTLSEPAMPARAASVRSADMGLQVGSIPGVLSDAENLAIAAAFQSAQTHTYTMGGVTRTTSVAPGSHLDVQA